jgi:hypothetical protein
VIKQLTLLLASAAGLAAAAGPAMIGYHMFPNGYVDDHAAEIRKIYDGFFYSVGTWENARARFEGASPKDAEWMEKTRRNIAALRKAGATENFLTVAFGDSAAWPSPETLLSKEYTETMVAEYAALARTARTLGFRGLCIDVEYPFPRYEPGNAIYTYKGYTAADLLSAARTQGRAILAAVLKEFPDAVIWSLPGQFRGRPIVREFSLGMLESMAQANAPGGFHQGTEFTYSLNDAVTHLATTRLEDVAMQTLVSGKTLAYWRARGTMAPGVWPLHMVETGGKDYPLQPWKAEMAELTGQMEVLRAASKRYVWSFTSNPAWYLWTPDLEAKYGLKKQDLKRDDIELASWHKLLASRKAAVPEKLKPLYEAMRAYDRGQLSAEALCSRFGAPARWWVLGYTGHVLKMPQFTAEEALEDPAVDTRKIYNGRDSGIRWFAWDNFTPIGMVNPRQTFLYRNTDAAGAHFRTYVEVPTARQAVLQLGWDDVVTVRVNGKVVFDTRHSDHPVKGAQYRDRFLFEKTLPVALAAGANRLEISTFNSHGAWVFATRITAGDGIPFPDLKFTLQPGRAPSSAPQKP